jgi:ribose-phosphate pyrophosphokinase
MKTLLLGEQTQLIKNISKNNDLELIYYEKFHFSNSNFIYQFNADSGIENLSIIVDLSLNLNENLWGLFFVLNFLREKKISIKKIIFPYFPYSRSNNKLENCTSGLYTIIHYLNQNSIEEIIIFDPHFKGQELPFKAIIKTITQEQIFHDILKNKKFDQALIVGPDKGSIERVKEMSKAFNIKSVTFNKQRNGHDEIVQIIIPDFVRNDIEKCNYFLIFDDEICSGDTLKQTINAIIQINRKAFIDVYITHNFINTDGGEIFHNVNKIYISNSIHNEFSHPNLTKIDLTNQIIDQIDI